MLETIRHIVNWWHDPGAHEANRIAVVAITADDEDGRRLAALSARCSWDLALAGSCEQALKTLEQARPAVILYDRDLPGADWREALPRLGKAGAVILTSPVNDRYLWEEVIRLGGYDVLAKPLHEDQTVRFVNLA